MEVYNNGGKHVKQNPSVKKNGTPVLAAVLIVALLSSCVHHNKEETNVNTDIVVNDPINLPGFNNDFIGMLDKLYEGRTIYYDQDQKMMNTDGYVLQFMKQLFDNENFSLNEQVGFFNDLYNDNSQIKLKAKEYVQSVNRGYDISFFELKDVNLENINQLKNSPGKLSLIKKYAKMYGLPEELMISIAANSNKNRDDKNIMGIVNVWGRLPSSRTAYNLETNQKDDLTKQQSHYLDDIEQNIKYACMIMAQSLKESDGNLDKAITYYYKGTPSMDNSHLDEKQMHDLVLSYLLTYMRASSVELDYKYTLDVISKDKKMVFESDYHYLDCINRVANWMGLQQKALNTGKGM